MKKVLGIDAKLDEIEFPGKTDPMVLIELAGMHGVDESQTRPRMKTLVESMVAYVEQHISEEALHPLPGVVRLLRTLRSQHAELGLVTGSFEPIAYTKVAKAGISSYFQSGIGGFGSDSEDRAEMIRIAMSRAREKIKTRFSAIYVGDTPRDVRAGHSAKLRVIAVATGGFSSKELKECGADLVVANLSNQDEFVGFLGP